MHQSERRRVVQAIEEECNRRSIADKQDGIKVRRVGNNIVEKPADHI